MLLSESRCLFVYLGRSVGRMQVHEQLMDRSRLMQEYKSGQLMQANQRCMLALQKMHIAKKRKKMRRKKKEQKTRILRPLPNTIVQFYSQPLLCEIRNQKFLSHAPIPAEKLCAEKPGDFFMSKLMQFLLTSICS